MNTTKDELDPRVEAVELDPLVEAVLKGWYRLNPPHCIIQWPEDFSDEAAELVRARMSYAIAAANAGRPALTAEDEEQAVDILWRKNVSGRKVARMSLSDLRREFDITPRQK